MNTIMSNEQDAWVLSQEVYDISSFNKTKHRVNRKTYYVLDRIDNGVNALMLGTKQDYDNMKSGHLERIKNDTVVFRILESVSISSTKLNMPTTKCILIRWWILTIYPFVYCLVQLFETDINGTGIHFLF